MSNNVVFGARWRAHISVAMGAPFGACFLGAGETGAGHDLAGPGLSLSRDAVLWRRQHAA